MKFLEASLEEVSREELKQAEVSICGEWGLQWEAADFYYSLVCLPPANHLGLCCW
jgi:hypothetical protein